MSFFNRYLPAVKKFENETPEEFAKRVQQMMASTMDVCPTNYTDADKIELAKRLFHRPIDAISRETQRIRAQNFVPNTSVSSVVTAVRSRGREQLEEMARKVKEVLPQVPSHVILKDIKVTTNVDETITRILDGTVSYVPEKLSYNKPTAQPSEKSSFQETSSKSTYLSTESSKPFYCGSKTFGKNANERSKSYAERKEALIEAARHRYLERHGLLNTETAGNK